MSSLAGWTSSCDGHENIDRLKMPPKKRVKPFLSSFPGFHAPNPPSKDQVGSDFESCTPSGLYGYKKRLGEGGVMRL